MALLNDQVNGVPNKTGADSPKRMYLIDSDCGTSAVKRLLPLHYEAYYSDPSGRSRIIFPKAPAAVSFRYFLGIYPLVWIL